MQILKQSNNLVKSRPIKIHTKAGKILLELILSCDENYNTSITNMELIDKCYKTKKPPRSSIVKMFHRFQEQDFIKRYEVLFDEKLKRPKKIMVLNPAKVESYLNYCEYELGIKFPRKINPNYLI
jgi:hypothetical protein